MKLSIIIPTLNEADNIEPLIRFFATHPQHEHLEVIVVDGGSTDRTPSLAQAAGAMVVTSEVASRPVQLNLGAQSATADMLYFVHADVSLPESFYDDIFKASQNYEVGCYRYLFDSSHPLLKINSFFSRFPMMWCRGGDQTLFITRSLFDRLGGFNEYYCVMEDFDLIRRARALTSFYIIPKSIKVSARKYAHNAYMHVQLTNLKAFRMFRKGVPPAEIRSFYKKALRLVDY
ncbi:TIGR04283 family arsenosugar biosynthesis glycosyltransferase [Marinoscillum furvescens]|uniref:RSAM/selenodomain-associated transferase 2 n=1 Tax=Marinoscillum furvescens DSM 4134 TaxID=1122208 RepID=A0A3D9KZQ0_MARFU|nr:TIGR04283 family arsenosugar biosynthesis glycosyltransferase [Marinoscillum furvescens]RED93901.1 rSAM/selenodomain-associated transferase 2 [Marinoscillum furvescens DSM 4134]